MRFLVILVAVMVITGTGSTAGADVSCEFGLAFRGGDKHRGSCLRRE